VNMVDIISKKRDGGILSDNEIEYFINGVTTGTIPDYQSAALLMAIYFKGMNRDETYLLTKYMLESGEKIDLSGIPGIKVDKHSTGGVGDKTTLIVAPIAAACGVPVAKMSGRGLGFTGGTVDKLDSIPGFRSVVSSEEFIRLVNKNGLSIIGQTSQLARADKILYSLRDVTATVDNISLITASVMSKKLASGCDAIILDVKCGKGAFMETLEEAEELARWLVDVGNAGGKKTIAVVSDMNQPLGRAVGNSVEVIEAIEILKDKGPADLRELAICLAGHMIYLGGKSCDPEQGRKMAEEVIKSGAALAKFRTFVEAQGGNPEIIEDYTKFPKAEFREEIFAEREGIVYDLNAGKVGWASQRSGAGRMTKESIIDYSAGIRLYKKVGDEVHKGDRLAAVFGNDRQSVKNAATMLEETFIIGETVPVLHALIKKTIE
jgi:pyrimidine-nucleoside phosphorylase